MIAGKIPLRLPVFLPATSSECILTVLDPGAFAVSFWNYEVSTYYGVPVSNYLRWILSSFIGVTIFDKVFDLDKVILRLEESDCLLDDMVSFVILWTIICLFYSLWIPALIGIRIGLTLYRIDIFDIPTSNYR